MRLLNTTTLTFEEFIDTQQVPYSILSHCWSQGRDKADKEVTYQDFISGEYDRNGRGWQKVRKCCRRSKAHGYAWTWIDTCCINKDSSAELTETINSMFQWYTDAAECYVFLDDYTAGDVPSYADLPAEKRLLLDLDKERRLLIVLGGKVSAFINSRWFSRGWTLQELLAPANVKFYNSDDHLLGTKTTLASIISYATGIDTVYLTGESNIRKASVAQRMSWAAARRTTRPEDIAYSLLGIFDVNMPLLYGERDKAFMRLQREIIARSSDGSILAWGLSETQTVLTGVLATSPSAFKTSSDITWKPDAMIDNHFTMTNRGLAVTHHDIFVSWATQTAERSIYDPEPKPPRPTAKVILQCATPDGMQVLQLAYHKGQWFRAEVTNGYFYGPPSIANTITRLIAIFYRVLRDTEHVIYVAADYNPDALPVEWIIPRTDYVYEHPFRLLQIALNDILPLGSMVVSTLTLIFYHAASDTNVSKNWVSGTLIVLCNSLALRVLALPAVPGFWGNREGHEYNQTWRAKFLRRSVTDFVCWVSIYIVIRLVW